MSCKTCKENLDTYLNGRLQEDMIRGIKVHLDECADCSNFYSVFLVSEKVI